ncbi:WXG100 family type VII secretion target [Prauserella cavernicola]|uniref:WXG100 family type VII secretion target n=1 Tax=Prauserella cavernicola TaxID=2800127 RepID=A0A934QQW2_9PSEU|nr:hypothetical protein [Prauserella cavernicola]MBK1784054.1 hypothetical protein [Prauserella cavernicola]
MAETETEAGGVTITTGEKDWGDKAKEAIPLAGGAIKAFDAAGKLTDGATGSEISGLVSESSGFVQGLGGAALGIATDPIGWLVGQGLDFLISVCQPLEDAIHFVSGDGPALTQAAENFTAIGQGVVELRQKFDEELKTSLQGWGGDASEAAGTKLGEFAKGIDGVAGQAGEVAEMLSTSAMIMSVVEDFIKALLTELITWLIMIWIPALAAAVPTAGASTAAAGTATATRAATTGGRVAQTIAKLRRLLDKIMDFLRSLRGRLGDLKTGFQRAMDSKLTRSHAADAALSGAGRNPLTQSVDRMWSKDGMLGDRLQGGFGSSMGGVLSDTAAAQVGAGTGANAGIDKAARNQGSMQAADEADEIGTDYTKGETQGYLDI